jgi:hypothetical protein
MSHTKPTIFDTRGRPLNPISATSGTTNATVIPQVPDVKAPSAPARRKWFGKMIPDAANNNNLPINVYKKVSFKTKLTGAILFTMVGLVYGYTIHNLRQEDFGDVLVPDSIKNKNKA